MEARKHTVNQRSTRMRRSLAKTVCLLALAVAASRGTAQTRPSTASAATAPATGPSTGPTSLPATAPKMSLNPKKAAPAGRAGSAGGSDFSNMSIEELMNIEVISSSKQKQHIGEVASAICVITQEDVTRTHYQLELQSCLHARVPFPHLAEE